MIIRSACRWLPTLLLFLAVPVAACSSFATYANGPLYGMNFDYPASAKIRFVIDTHGDLKVFHLTFSRYERFIPTVGMNSAGLFISDQILEGERTSVSGLDGETLFPWQLYHRALQECTDVATVRNFLAKRRLHNDPFLGLHLLIADSSGDALIAEVGAKENALMGIKGDFIVMTNFSLVANRGRNYDDMSGVGAERYRIIYEELVRNGAQFDVEQTFAFLSSATNCSPSYPTRCSMVFDPGRGEIFIAMETDYTRIWKVSLAVGTIETYRGFAEHRQWPLGTDGILATDLN